MVLELCRGTWPESRAPCPHRILEVCHSGDTAEGHRDRTSSRAAPLSAGPSVLYDGVLWAEMTRSLARKALETRRSFPFSLIRPGEIPEFPGVVGRRTRRNLARSLQ